MMMEMRFIRQWIFGNWPNVSHSLQSSADHFVPSVTSCRGIRNYHLRLLRNKFQEPCAEAAESLPTFTPSRPRDGAAEWGGAAGRCCGCAPWNWLKVCSWFAQWCALCRKQKKIATWLLTVRKELEMFIQKNANIEQKFTHSMHILKNVYSLDE